jgi:hypothetical protein
MGGQMSQGGYGGGGFGRRMQQNPLQGTGGYSPAPQRPQPMPNVPNGLQGTGGYSPVPQQPKPTIGGVYNQPNTQDSSIPGWAGINQAGYQNSGLYANAAQASGNFTPTQNFEQAPTSPQGPMAPNGSFGGAGYTQGPTYGWNQGSTNNVPSFGEQPQGAGQTQGPGYGFNPGAWNNVPWNLFGGGQ